MRPSKVISEKAEYPFQFSICTLVTDHQEYSEMKGSCIEAGFGEDDCEYLIIDNSTGNAIDAYKGLNLFLQQAQGRYIIICHQDIIMHDDRRPVLEDKINEINQKDPKWGVLGNAGGVNLKYQVVNLTRGNGEKLTEKHAPIQVMSVDENFMLLKKSANLALSRDLSGFHMYGADICTIADVLGFTCYVIPFNIIHKSDGNINKTFYDGKKEFIKKYKRAFRSRFLSTTVTRLYLNSSTWKTYILNKPFFIFLFKQYYKLIKVKKPYSIKYKQAEK